MTEIKVRAQIMLILVRQNLWHQLIGIEKTLPKLGQVKLFSLKSSFLKTNRSLLNLFYCEFIFKWYCTWVGLMSFLIIL